MRNLVAISTDGASVMLGRKYGVATTLARKFPNIITWHCLNHRLELAVSDAIRKNKAVNHFQIFFDKLYSIYSRSPKNKRKLSECSKEIDIQLQKIGRIFSVRWVASSYRTVAAVWNNFKPLCLHFEHASCDMGRNSAERALFGGLLKRIRSPEFITDLGIMYDALFELSELSESLQDCDCTILIADKLLHR